MPEFKVRIGCVVLAVVMSAVTYYFVEPRLRWGRYGGYKAAGLLSVMIVIGVAGYSVERHDGYTARMNDPEQAVIDAINKRMDEDNRRCLKEIPDWNQLSVNNSWGITLCHLQRAAGYNSIALIGDSNAGHFYPGLSELTSDYEGIASFSTNCATPLIGLQTIPYANSEHLMTEGFHYILSHKNIKKVVLSHNATCSWQKLVDTNSPDNHDFNSILHDGFVRTYDALTKAGKDIYVVLNIPYYKSDNWLKCQNSVVQRPIAIPVVLYQKSKKICTEPKSERPDKEMVDNWSKVARKTAKNFKNIHFIDMADVFCPNETCSMLDNKGTMLYIDNYHLNMNGSIYAAQIIMELLRK